MTIKGYPMPELNIVSIRNLNKTYAPSSKSTKPFVALSDINLDIKKGEIFALLGPNGAGKTTLISSICGITNPTSGEIKVNGLDVLKDYKEARALIGLVPQELTVSTFETVEHTLNFSRGLFNLKKNQTLMEKILKDLALYDKRKNKLLTLSGGMKRRVMIGKALAHEPKILFLDEPSAGVDVELRKGMWEMVRSLKNQGVTIILTTHYLEEAEDLADRIGIINHGKIILVEEKKALMKKMGLKKCSIRISKNPKELPSEFYDIMGLSYNPEKFAIYYEYNFSQNADQFEMPLILKLIEKHDLQLKDIQTKESSLEEIFVKLLKQEN